MSHPRGATAWTRPANHLNEAPFRTEPLAGTGGLIGPDPEDFAVEEIPAYLPDGRGPHLMFQIEKRGITTWDAIQALAGAVDRPASDFGYAGLKDRWALARQYLTVPEVPAAAVTNLKLDGIKVLSAERHSNKLRTGHLRGNRFVIRLYETNPRALERGGRVLEELAKIGMPNLYGPQRFGPGGRNVLDGLALLAGRESPRFKKRKRFLVSAAQAELFNVYLIDRMKAATADQVLKGDVLRRGRAFFVAEEPASEQTRVDRGEVTLTGPIYGPRSPRPEEGSEPRKLEDAVLASYGLTLEDFKAQKRIGRGGRRDLAVRPENSTAVQPDQTTGTLELRFTLPPGSYATVLIREVLKVPFRSLRAGSAGRKEQGKGPEG